MFIKLDDNVVVLHNCDENLQEDLHGMGCGIIAGTSVYIAAVEYEAQKAAFDNLATTVMRVEENCCDVLYWIDKIYIKALLEEMGVAKYTDVDRVTYNKDSDYLEIFLECNFCTYSILVPNEHVLAQQNHRK